MSKPNIEKLRARILAERDRLTRQHERLTDHGDGMSNQLGEIADFDPNHPGDMGTETFELAKDVALHDNVEAMRAQIDEALAKMDAGTYGICDRCGRPIADARLTDLPYATLCIDCQSYIENAQ